MNTKLPSLTPAAPAKPERGPTRDEQDARPFTDSQRLALAREWVEREIATLRLLERLIREAAANRHLHPHGKEALTGIAFQIHAYIQDRERDNGHE